MATILIPVDYLRCIFKYVPPSLYFMMDSRWWIWSGLSLFTLRNPNWFRLSFFRYWPFNWTKRWVLGFGRGNSQSWITFGDSLPPSSMIKYCSWRERCLGTQNNPTANTSNIDRRVFFPTLSPTFQVLPLYCRSKKNNRFCSDSSPYRLARVEFIICTIVFLFSLKEKFF